MSVRQLRNVTTFGLVSSSRAAVYSGGILLLPMIMTQKSAWAAVSGGRVRAVRLEPCPNDSNDGRPAVYEHVVACSLSAIDVGLRHVGSEFREGLLGRIARGDHEHRRPLSDSCRRVREGGASAIPCSTAATTQAGAAAVCRPTTKLREAADDDLREQARAVLAKAIRGEDVPKAALDSARSLFSYRADSPPLERAQEHCEYAGGRFSGHRPLSKGLRARDARPARQAGG